MAYINGAASISPQKWTEPSNYTPTDIVHYNTAFISVMKPEYKEFIKPMQVRRMSNTVKNSIVASALAMKQAECEMPQAVVVGSGLGVVSDTENFLEKILDDNEQFLTPTSFIQSTHNTPAAHIAARLACHAYNFTYINRGHSFENALQDAFMQLADNKNDILTGGSDEMTEQYFRITQKGGWWKQEDIESGALYKSETSGALCGEGSHFFVLSGEKSQKNQSQIQDLQTYTGEKTAEEIKLIIKDFLEKNNLQLSDIDLILSGNSGDARTDHIYGGLNAGYFSQNAVAGFKHLCGEHHTASAFALWLANASLHNNTCPELLQGNAPKELKSILIYNHFFNINHSLFLIKKV